MFSNDYECENQMNIFDFLDNDEQKIKEDFSKYMNKPVDELSELYKQADYKDNLGMLFNADCIDIMKKMDDCSVDLTLTDIPYGEVNRKDNGLRNLNKENADILTFNLDVFLDEIYRVTKGTVIIFCGIEQVSVIANYFSSLQKQQKGTMRHLVWTKTNPSPMNGDYIYLSAIENAIWFKKRGATFNAHCKKNYFSYPCGRSKLHPTEKNNDLIKELILDNSNENQIVFDSCAGSGSHLDMAKVTGRRYIGCEFDEKYFEIAKKRIYETEVENEFDNEWGYNPYQE